MVNEIKDWRGTPITMGVRVLTHSKNWNHGLGVIDAIHPTTITVRLQEHDYLHKEKILLVTIPHSVTVLTKDMFDDA